MRQSKKASPIRKGFDYQDCVAVLFLLELITPGSEVLRVWIESEAGKHIDDVQVETARWMRFYQIKYAVKRSDSYAFINLTEKKTARTRSLVQKFANSWKDLRAQTKPITLHLYSNRVPSGEQDDLEAALDDTILKPSFLSNQQFASIREEWNVQTKLLPEEFRDFVQTLRFDLKMPELEVLEAQVEKRLQFLGIPQEKQHILFQQCKEWAKKRREPIEKRDILRLLGLPDRWGDDLNHVFPVEESHLIPINQAQTVLDTLIANRPGGYITITGKPGSGKSTFLHQYVAYRKEQFKDRIIAYYCFLDVTDPQTRDRISADSFIRSIIRQIHEEFPHLFNNFQYYGSSQQKLEAMLRMLGERAVAMASKVIIVVDGIDHVERLGKIFSGTLLSTVLPFSVPTGVIFLVSAQAHHYLPSYVRSDSPEASIVLKGFDLQETTAYLQKRFARQQVALEESLGLNQQEAEEVYRKTEGFPLYLHYLTEQFLTGRYTSMEELLAKVPLLKDGDIYRYYRYIWDEVAHDMQTRYLLMALMLMRFSVPETLLFRVVEKQLPLLDCASKLENICHLLHMNEQRRVYRIFHNSFKDFIADMAEQSNNSLLAKQLIRSIFTCLQQEEQTPLALAHLFYYAQSCEELEYILEHANLEYIHRCIESVRPFPEIQDNLRIALETAVQQQNLVHLTRLCLLISHSIDRFDNETLDYRQFYRTLLAMGRTEEILQSLLYRGIFHGNPNALLDVIVQLPSQGAIEIGRQLWHVYDRAAEAEENSSTFYESHQTDRKIYVCALAAYRYDPIVVIEWIRETKWSWHAEYHQEDLLRIYVQSLHAYKHEDLLEVICARSTDELAIVFACGEAIDSLVAREETKQAQALFRSVFQLSALSQKGNVLYAHLAARCHLPREEVLGFLGNAHEYPDLKRDRMHIREEVEADLRRLNAYVCVLSYCHADEELTMIREMLQKANNWYVVSFFPAFELALIQGKLLAGEHFDGVAKLLAALDQLSQFPQNNEVWAQATFFQAQAAQQGADIATVFLAHFSQASTALVDQLAALGHADAFSIQGYLQLLEACAAREICRAPLLKLLPDVSKRIYRELLEGRERSRAYIWLAGIAGQCADQQQAETYLRQGIQASHCHGSHKDIVLSGLVTALSTVNTLDATRALERGIQVSELLRWLHIVTDRDNVSFIPVNFCEAIGTVNLEAGFHLLPAIERDWGAGTLQACIRTLTRVLMAFDPILAWELAETLTECDSDGYHLKQAISLKIEICASACKLAHPMASELAERTRIAILTDLLPVLRGSAVQAYRALANEYPHLILETIADQQETENQDKDEPFSHRTQELHLVVDSQDLDLAQVEMLAAQSWEQFRRVARKAEEAGWPYEIRSSLQRVLIERYITQARSNTMLEQIERLIDETGISTYASSIKSVFAALADKCLELGLFPRFTSYTCKHLELTHFWHPFFYGAEGDQENRRRFKNLATHAPQVALQFIYTSFSEKQQTTPEAVGMLCQLLPELGMAEHVPPIYNIFYEFCQSFFMTLPPLPEQETWLSQFSPTRTPVVSLVVCFLVQRLASLEYKVREKAIISLFRLSQAYSNECIPLLFDALKQPDYSIRIGIMAVVSSLATFLPDSVSSWREQIEIILNSQHAILVELAEYTIMRLDTGTSASMPGISSQKRNGLVAQRPNSTLFHIPVGASRETERVIGSIPAMADLVEKIVELLGVEESWVIIKVEQELERLGFDKREVNRQDRELSRRLYDYSEKRLSVPVELRHAHFLRHAISHVAQELIDQTCPNFQTEDLLRSHFRLFDPALPSLTIRPKPEEIMLDFGTGNDGWETFQDIQDELQYLLAEDEWTTLFEITNASLKHRQVQIMRFVCLLSSNVSDEQYQNILQTQEGAPLPLTPSGYGEVPLHIAQDLALAARQNGNRMSGVTPLLVLHINEWLLCGGSYCLITLAEPYRTSHSLQWLEPQSLDLQRNEEPVTRTITWRDGYQLTRNNVFRPASHGTLFQARTNFLKEVAAYEQSHILRVDKVTRTIRGEHPSSTNKRNGTKAVGCLLRFPEEGVNRERH